GNVLLVEGSKGPLYLIEIEFQSTLHPYMPLNSLVNCARAKKKYWKAYGNLPIIAAVIYLFDEQNIPDPPLRWSAPIEETTLLFSYLSIQMKELPRQELLGLQEPELWPLALLTEGQVDRIIVSEMFTDLLNHKRYQTLSIGHIIASWLLRGEDLDWLNKEYQKMYELFEDSPAWKWMEESARQDERKKTLATLRQGVVEMVALHFPKLERLAKAQVRLLDQTERFTQVMLRLSQAQNSDEAQDVLLSLDENEEAEKTQEPM
ncbi:MAG: hypothetical protein JOZ18_18155, partial [Chloroflexi bacterium]|nr:hypothetical protein [Chloroflexota bacterium]